MKCLFRAALLPVGLWVALSLSGCGTTVAGGEGGRDGDSGSGTGAAPDCDVSDGVAKLPDGSVEAEPSDWLVPGYSAIDDAGGACGSARSIRMKLDKGLGYMEVTRSPYFEHIELNKEYTVSFHYRYENCADAQLWAQVGNYEKHLQLDGTDTEWKKASMVIEFSSKPSWIDFYPMRMGSYLDYQDDKYDNNLIWIDDVVIK